MRAISKAIQNLKKAVGTVGLELERVCPLQIESNMANAERSEKASFDEPIPMEDLLVLEGSLDGHKIRILKDDGCNTNVVPHEFSQANREKFNWEKCNVEVSHSMKDSIENDSSVLLAATLRIDKHFYKSNWLVANCRYDILLGMQWHVTYNSSIDYQKKTVSVDTEVLSKTKQRRNTVEVMNVSVKKFKNMCGKKKAEIQVFQLSKLSS